MSIRTTVTLDEDVLERVKEESKQRGASFKDTINELLRTALVLANKPAPRRKFKVRARKMGIIPGLNYDNTESLIEYLEGPWHR
ncbi:MAG TPA: CopG family transcriptional regulator [Bryobacteraceae bacterium]|jgi:hypothetical protein